MSKHKQCPTCGNKNSSTSWTDAFIWLHRCKDKEHLFCDECKNGDRCPLCQSDNIAWNWDKAHNL